MRKTLKWTLPAALALVAIVGWSFRSAVAQNAMAKGKVTVTVKGPMGEIGANVPVSLLKGNVPMPAGGGGRRGGGGGGGAPPAGGAAPASQPAPLKTGTTDAKGVYTFADVDAGEYTVFAGAGGGGGRRGGGGGAGAPPAGGPPATAPGVRGRGAGTGMVKAGEELKLDITLMAGGRGGGGGQGGGGGRRGGGGGGGAPPAGGAAPGAGA